MESNGKTEMEMDEMIEIMILLHRLRAKICSTFIEKNQYCGGHYKYISKNAKWLFDKCKNCSRFIDNYKGKSNGGNI